MRWIFILLIFLTKSILADWEYCSNQGYCLDVPDSMIVISSENYQDHSKKLPESIVKQYQAGNRREIIIDKTRDTLNKEGSFFVIKVSPHAMQNIDVQKTCQIYRRLEGDSLKQCGQLPGYKKEGFWSLTYNENLLSYTRIRIELDKDHHIYAVSAEKFANELLFRRVSYGMMKILRTIRPKE
jgi:hypothetical protein